MMKFSKHNRSRLWLLTALLVLALSVTLFAACDRTPNEPDTSDPAVSVDSPTETNENGDPATREPSEDTTAPAEPDGTEEPSESGEDSDTVTEEPTDPPVITIPGDEPVSKPSETEAETLPYDPELHPGDSAAYKGVLIHSVYGTGKKGAEALISNGYVQLYNASDKDVALTGASLYYKSD